MKLSPARERWPLKFLLGSLFFIAFAAGTSDAQTSADDIVLYASEASVRVGRWDVVSDQTAAGGWLLSNPDAAAAKLATPLANPANYFELTFHATAGKPYHLWVRGKALRNHYNNDSIYVQFSGSVTQAGAAQYRIGTTSALFVSIEEGSSAGLAGWGWNDNSYGGLGTPIYFQTSGLQTIRIQQREDGIALDQIVLSPDTYLNASPGATKNDTRILPKTVFQPPPPNEPPSVSVVAQPTAGQAPLSVSFTANAGDSDGSIATYNWDFGNGQTSGTGPNAATTFSAAGTYTAVVTVRDNGGVAASAAVTISVSPPAPTPTPRPIQTGAVDITSPPAAADPVNRNVTEYEKILEDGEFNTVPWQVIAQRAEIQPASGLDANVGHNAPGSLVLAGGANPAANGYWQTNTTVTGGESYRFTAYYKTAGIAHPRQSVHVRVEWRDAANKALGNPDFIAESFAAGDWRRADAILTAPATAARAYLHLGLRWAAGGTVWWDDVRIARVSAPAARTVRVATIYNRPSGQKFPANINSFVAKINQAGAAGAQIALVSEAINLIGNGSNYVQYAETIPGPTTNLLGQAAVANNLYVIAGVIEREGTVVYNSSVLINKQGQIIGKYRKAFLPRGEVDGGITPGTGDFPVFDLEFGRIGMMICYDMVFADASRVLGAKGAEMIFMPTWGNHDLLTRARPVENHLILVTSSYDSPTGIIDPTGNYVVQATSTTPVVYADVDLSKQYAVSGVNKRNQFFSERRGDFPLEP